jgi:hypothetical protein
LLTYSTFNEPDVSLSPTPPAAASTAFTITVAQTLAVLDGPFASLAEGIANGRYALWLGSGISRDAVDGLWGLVQKALRQLRDQSDFSDANCVYAKALVDAVALARLSSADQMAFDMRAPHADWGGIGETIVTNLCDKYSRFLDIRIPGKKADHLLWEVVDVPATYAAAGLEPQCEHICVALLAVEAAVRDIPTANWDGLIEAAVADLTGGAGQVLSVCVIDDDFRDPPPRARLLKFHGCAVRARDNPLRYREMLVGRQQQIEDWATDDDHKVMRQQMVGIATIQRTLMIGLSAQDTNIRDVFRDAKNTMGWVWPSNPPAYVFAEDKVGDEQTAILKSVYKTAFDADPESIITASQIRAFAKPLLLALVLDVLFRKMAAILRCAPTGTLSIAGHRALDEGLRRLRDRIAAAGDGDRTSYVRGLTRELARGLRLFRTGRPDGAGAYEALGAHTVSQISTDPQLGVSGLPELGTVLGLLGLGDAERDWAVQRADPTTPLNGAVSVVSDGKTHRLFFVANQEASLKLYSSGVVRDDESDALIIYSTTPTARLTRSPRISRRSLDPKTGLPPPTTRKVGVRALLEETSDLAVLRRRFREEAVL